MTVLDEDSFSVNKFTVPHEYQPVSPESINIIYKGNLTSEIFSLIHNNHMQEIFSVWCIYM